MELDTLYANRFSEDWKSWRKAVWTVLYQQVFAKHLKGADVIVDLGAGYCEFINVAEGRRRIAVDLNPDTPRHATAGVEVHRLSADRLDFLADGSVDVVFSSNFLEHLPDKLAVLAVVREAHRILRPGGVILLLGPNVRLLPGRYWDFFDHQVPLSDRSIRELLELAHFFIEGVRSRFLPYSTRGAYPRWIWLVRAYLNTMPVSSFLFGKQFLAVARKGAPSPMRKM